MQLISMDNNPGPPHSQPSAGPGSQIRSRVTVVCAECKRLKLKCDRRTPCSSCLKRDTVPRCTYSAAAAEKIDVQSLHNRVLILEAQLAQLTSGGMKVSPHDVDHALLAVGSSGSSVLVPLDDVAGVWIEDLNLGRDSGIELQPAFLGGAADPEGVSSMPHGSSPPSRSSSTHSSPHPTSTASGSSSLPFCSLSQTSPTMVTPALLALLPAAPQRQALLNILGSVLRMHPSLNFPHFRARINGMFTDGSGPEEIGIGPSRTSSADRPSLSFFAAAAAGFALAMQCMPPAGPGRPPSPQTSPSTTPTPRPTVSSLLALSAHALDLSEDTAPYDLDFLHALVLRCLCMLHDGVPRVSQAVFTNVGKMVNIARMMGLARDPDEFSSTNSSKYTLWDAEMRRRMWWDVFYYDLFVSDCMGLPPLISDDQHTCRLPADVDEDAFVPNSVALPQPADHPSATNFSYFLQKCKIAQLVKNTKKRTSLEPSSSSGGSTPTPSEPSLDAASQAESEIQQYLSDLPQVFKLDVDTDSSDPDSKSTSPRISPSVPDTASPHLVVQRCELVTLAHQLVLKLFHPFLRRSNVRPPHNAMVACINATHAIIQASRIAQRVWHKHGSGGAPSSPGTGPGTNIPSSHGVFYPFARQLFDATVVAAHVVIQAPQSVFAKVALDDVRTGLDVLRDPSIATGRGRSPSRGGVEGCPSEAVRIVEMMMHKAEMAKRNFAPVAAGMKRKHEEVEACVGKGFWLPYVGTGVATEGTSAGVAGGNTSAATSVRPAANLHGSPRAKLSDKPFALENPPHTRVSAAPVPTREREKERKYPVVGIRNRTTGVMGDRLGGAGLARSRRESSVPRQQPPTPSGDSGAFALPPVRTSVQPEPIRATTGEFSLSAPYALEDAHMVNMTVSPTTTFQSQPQAAPYSTPSFQPAVGSAPHQPVYESSPYTPETGIQPAATHSFYVAYQHQHQQPAPPPPQSTYQPMDSHSHPHHRHLDMAPMDMLQNQASMDASDLERATKQEEGTERQESHRNDSPYGSADGWADAGVAARFSTQPTWDPRYNY